MPTDHLSEIFPETKKNLEKYVRNKRLEHAELTSLMMEISQEYSYTMNSIIFDKYLTEHTEFIFKNNIYLF